MSAHESAAAPPALALPASDPHPPDRSGPDPHPPDPLTPDPHPPASLLDDRMAALPVDLDLRGRHADGVRAWIEGTLGWQPVAGATAGLVPPAVVLRDLGSSHIGGGTGSVPTVLLVDDDASPLRSGEVVAAMTPDAIVAWPSGRDGLVEVVDRVLARPRRRAALGSVLRIGGSAGGVGTTTVALALAGLAAWNGTATLAAVRGTGLAPPIVPTASLEGLGVWSRAEPLAGVPAARAVRLVDCDEAPATTDPEIGLLVLDTGVDPEVDVLVCRPDGAALEMLASTTAAAVVVVGEGAAELKDLRRAAAGRRGILLPWSVRVGRAGLAGRVPSGVPGAWLRRLRPLLPDELSAPSSRGAGSP